jgi:hypothetical protein
MTAAHAHKEVGTMRSIWKKKWFVIAAAVAIFLSVGAVAWAATGDDDPAAATTAASETTPTTAAAADDAITAESIIAGLAQGLGDGSGTPADKASAAVKQIKQRAQKWAQRQAALMNKLRESMTPADQALYDQLVTKLKQQREALKEARKNLGATLKDLRDLRDKYLDATTATTAPSS